MRYDYVFVTPLPAFYKVNLYNELYKKMNIFVIFIGDSSIIRTKDFTSCEINFNYHIINSGNFEDRNKLYSCFKLIKLLHKICYKKIVVGGWDLVEYWLCLLLNSNSKNAVVVESTSIESNLNFFKRTIKKGFFKRINLAFPSGRLHQDLIEKLGYKNKISVTKGVGIFKRLNYQRINKPFEKKFLYVGRLSKEKNVEFLIKFFNDNNQYSLTIVGKGPLREVLQAKAKKNIKFIDHVPNEKISEIYLSHDIFILPSFSEPWGLVIDEALYFGLPVLVSKNVGCASELVINRYNGIVLEELSSDCLASAISEIISHYQDYKDNVGNFDFNVRDNEQINAYLRGLE